MFYEILIPLVIVAGLLYRSRSRSKKIAALKLQYDQLLRGGDKPAALIAGRAYYSAMRDGKMLTIYDEQAITNDLSTMS